MGRIPKAEKEKAIRNLNSECDEEDDLVEFDEEEEDEETTDANYTKQNKQIKNGDSVNSEDDPASEGYMEDSINSELENSCSKKNVFSNSTHVTTAHVSPSETNQSVTEKDSLNEWDIEVNLIVDKHKGYLLTFLGLVEKKLASSQKSNSPNTNDRRNIKPIKLNDLLNEVFHAPSVISGSFEPDGPVYKSIFSLLNERIMQTYCNCTTRSYEMYDKLIKELNEDKEAVNARIARNNAQDASLVLKELLSAMPYGLEMAVKFGKETPGMSQLNSSDYSKIIHAKHYDYFMIISSMLFIDGESYMFLTENAAYTRYWMLAVKKKIEVDLLFEFTEILNSLLMTKTEKALLIAVIFTMPGK